MCRLSVFVAWLPWYSWTNLVSSFWGWTQLSCRRVVQRWRPFLTRHRDACQKPSRQGSESWSDYLRWGRETILSALRDSNPQPPPSIDHTAAIFPGCDAQGEKLECWGNVVFKGRQSDKLFEFSWLISNWKDDGQKKSGGTLGHHFR